VRRKPGRPRIIESPEAIEEHVAGDGGPSPFSEIQHPKKRAFLRALVETGGNVTRACELVGIDRSTPYSRQWKEDAEFQAVLESARYMAAEALESEAIRRAFEGVDKPTGWYKGKPSGVVTDYSDTLLIFLLKGAKPEKYADRMELRGNLANMDLTQLPDEALSRLARGEHPLTVLSSLSEDVRTKLLGTGERKSDEVSE
jgi:hypothetical protein